MTHRDSTSDQMMHYDLLTVSNLSGRALTLTIIFFLTVMTFKERKETVVDTYSLYS